jgi:DNA-binding CsgD family transcriptional regulator/tetratricopeptide (TPR) repeat protein
VVDVLARRAFIGRVGELAGLIDLLAEVEAGHGRTAIVAGEGGVGKSRLIARLAEVAADRATIEVGACLPSSEGGLPYGPFVEILRRVIAATDPAALPALLGPGRRQLTRLLPELAAREADVTVSSDVDPTAQVRLFELLLGVFTRLARRRPLVLAVEDIQWADRSTRELVGFLARALRDEPVLLVISVRTEDVGAAAPLAFLAELERDDGVQRIDLEPFGRAEVADQLHALLDGPQATTLVDRLFERSDGNPFFVEELVLAGAADRTDLPPVVRDVVAARMAGLSAPTREALRAAAVGGRSIDDELVCAVLGVGPRALAASLREAVDAGILERIPAALGATSTFRHALLQEVVDAELFPAERAELHLAFARSLEARAAGGRRVEPADLARHWDGARMPEQALRPMIEAALAAEGVYAWPEALEHWQRARALFGTIEDGAAIAGLGLGELDGRGADCALMAGEYDAAIALARAAIDAVDPVAEPTLAGLLHNRLRWALWESGDRAGAAEAVESALRLLPTQPPTQARASALAQHAGILVFAGKYAASQAEAREAIAMARALDAPGELALALGVLGWGLAALGDVEGGLERFREGAAIAATIGSAEGVSLAAINLVTLLDRVGRSREQLEAALEAHRASERLGVGRTYGALLLGYAAKAQFVLGLWDDADRTTETGLHVGASDRAELWLSINRARLLAARGQFDAAAPLLERARVLARRLGPSEFSGPLLQAEAELGVWLGDLEAVRRAGRSALQLATSGGPPDPSLAWLAIAVVRAEADAAERYRGRPGHDAAAPDASWLTQIEDAVQAVLADRPELAAGARSDAIRGLLRAERGRLAGPPDPVAWSPVVGAWDAVERPYLAAYARFRAAAATIAARGSREAAAELLLQARATATALGAEPLLGLIDDLARAARLALVTDRPASGAPDPYGFTAREREVLALVVAGWTNQQIAERLFITRKTASVHVSNLMAKLGAANRGEAAAMAHRLGLVEP